MIIPLNLGEQSYNIVLERGALNKAAEYLNLNRKCLIVTDSGVPSEYSQAIKNQAKEGYMCVIPQGEKSKSFDNYKMLLEKMIEYSFTRTDCVIAVGGGVVGDLSGFVASSYMRGVDFYNIPTTLLSQVDSSIGGKVAIDVSGVKNIIGAFYQPKKVLIDSDTLKTLEIRQVNAGLCEAIKMSLTSDKELFTLIENSTDLINDIDTIIEKSLLIKKNVVEIDPKEKGLRKVLNFGHTIGHAIESYMDGKLLHGECVALGMLPLCSQRVKARLIKILEKYSLNNSVNIDTDILISYITHDKKSSGTKITTIFVNEIGSFEMREMEIEDMRKFINGGIL
jgi:3-dehydroquinate synthase